MSLKTIKYIVFLFLVALFIMGGCNQKLQEREPLIKKIIVENKDTQKTCTFTDDKDVALFQTALDESSTSNVINKWDDSKIVYKISYVYKNGGTKDFIAQFDMETHDGIIKLENETINTPPAELPDYWEKPILKLLKQKGVM